MTWPPTAQGGHTINTSQTAPRIGAGPSKGSVAGLVASSTSGTSSEVAFWSGSGQRRPFPEVSLGARVRAARQRSGLTQAALASGVASTAYISRIESGQRTPNAALLSALAERLGVPVESLTALEEVTASVALHLVRAELLLAHGDAHASVKLTSEVREQLPSGTDVLLHGRARLLLARAHLGASAPVPAIATLLGEPGPTQDHVASHLGIGELTTLAECHLMLWQPGTAVEVAARALDLVLVCRMTALPAAREVASVLSRALAASGRHAEAAQARHLVAPGLPTRRLTDLATAQQYFIAGVAHQQHGLSVQARRLAERAHHHLDLVRAEVVWQQRLEPRLPDGTCP